MVVVPEQPGQPAANRATQRNRATMPHTVKSEKMLTEATMELLCSVPAVDDSELAIVRVPLLGFLWEAFCFAIVLVTLLFAMVCRVGACIGPSASPT